MRCKKLELTDPKGDKIILYVKHKQIRIAKFIVNGKEIAKIYWKGNKKVLSYLKGKKKKEVFISKWVGISHMGLFLKMMNIRDIPDFIAKYYFFEG